MGISIRINPSTKTRKLAVKYKRRQHERMVAQYEAAQRDAFMEFGLQTMIAHEQHMNGEHDHD